MNFYYAIKSLDDNRLYDLISLKLSEAKYRSSAISKRFIGVDCDINPRLLLDREEEYQSQSLWSGFIPEDVKIIYSFLPDKNGFTVNNGCYYYIDDNDYIFEFINYIKTKEIRNDFDFFKHLQIFMNSYFYNLEPTNISREQMHKPFIDNHGHNVCSNKHSIRDFKYHNNAKCSEYSTMAQNILSLFGYKSLLLVGSVNSQYGRGAHMFNLCFFGNIPYVVDFFLPVEAFSLDSIKLETLPFVGTVNNLDQNTIILYLKHQIPFDLPDYYYFNGQMISNGYKRNYVLGKIDYYDKKGTLQKKEKTIKKN